VIRKRGLGKVPNRSGRSRGVLLALCLTLILAPCPLPLVPCSLPLVPCPLTLAAENVQPTPPQLTKTVNDFANVIDDASEREMDRRIRALQHATGDVVVVATVPTIEPYSDITEYAVKMFENGGRGIGQKGKDNGALIVIAIKQRAIKIEVGYDLEEFITDGYAGTTIREVIAPQFKSGAYGPGLLAGTTRIINRVAERRGVELTDVPRDQRDRRPVGTPFFFSSWKFILLAWIIIAILSSRRRQRRRHWGGGPWSGWNSGVGPFGGGFGGFGGGFGGFGGGGGGGGGGFGGFGGGRSGGGGASGSW
jgi:uncharacterized protein